MNTISTNNKLKSWNLILFQLSCFILICLLFLITSIDVSARNLAPEQTTITVKGIVTDVNNEPLPGVSVLIKNKSIGTITDLDGSYEIVVPEINNVLVFSFMGMKSQEFTITASKKLSVILLDDINALDEIVVTGYQKVDKRTFTGSVSRVGNEQLGNAGLADVSRMLQGTVAGVSVENVSGTFGSKAKIRIRGNSSISGNQEPVWVVDGIVMDDPVDINPNELYSGDPATLVSSAISGINPNDIEDIQVLKDASATAMYGTQAVNGVIVITTKRGKAGKLQVNYNNNFTISLKPSITDFNVMNSKERLEFSEEMYQKNLMDVTNLNNSYGAYGLLLNRLSKKEITWDEFDDDVRKYKRNNTDWFDELFRNSLTQEHSLSISSGNSKSQYYFSGSYFDDNGYTIGQFAKRYTANMRANFQINNRFSIGTILTGSIRNQRVSGNFEDESENGVSSREFTLNPYQYARTTSRAMRPYGDDGEKEYYLRNYAPFNIIDELENNFINIKAQDIKLQVDLNYKILKNLSYHGILSGRYTSSFREHIVTERSNVANSYRAMGSEDVRLRNDKLYNDPDDNDQNPISILPRGGMLITDNTLGNFYTVRNSVNWKPRIGHIHFFDILAGTEFRNKSYDSYYNKGYGYEFYKGQTASPDYLAIKRDLLTDGESYYNPEKKIYYDLSFFANLAYSFKERYNATFSVRSDGSNRLGKSQRFKFLPIWVVGFSWNIDKEAFMDNITAVNFLKLRTSYGLRGNVGGLGSPTMLAYYEITKRFDGQDNEGIITIYSPDNPNLQWEKEKMFSIALDFQIFERFSGVFEYYDRYNYDLIGDVEVSAASGFQDKKVNWANMQNKGIEITLNSLNIDKPNFSWNTVITFGYNKNKILDAFFQPTVSQLTIDEGASLVGGPLKGLYSFKFAELDSEGIPTFYNENGEVVSSITQYSNDVEMLNYEGSREPLGTGGFSNNFRYKNFSVSILFTYSFGNKIRLNSFFSDNYSDFEALDKELVNRWTAPGDEQYTNVPRILEKEAVKNLDANNSSIERTYNRSDIRVADGSFIRFKNISVSYNIPQHILQKVKISSAQLRFQGQNLYVWADSKLNGQDPESFVTGINIPSPTTISFGLKVGF